MKPDQSITRRKQLGLIKLNVDFETAKQWIQDKLGSKIEVEHSLFLISVSISITPAEPVCPPEINQVEKNLFPNLGV